ncbi:MAG TPA: alpha/beta hydrolase [Dermatophilaceae bacterium]|nr:alpha/beta hydrolase [Dermatophilaceae bacterium]
MQNSTLTVKAADGIPLHVYVWAPKEKPKAVVQIAHGMAEHAARYERFAEHLTGRGYAVYAQDHRGHGKTAGSLDNVGYFADSDGFEKVVEDLYAVTRKIQADHPELPVFLFGHSMGSIIARAYVMSHGDALRGLVLTGAGGDPGALAKVGAALAFGEGLVRGRKARSKLLDTMTFGKFNDAFKPARTGFDWLSRDKAEVDKYIQDPWCGGVFTTGFFGDLLHGVGVVNNPANIATVPKDLPIFVLSGEKDPVGDNGKGVRQVVEQYRTAGVRHVEMHLYPLARHEILNETNRDEVMKDISTWLDARL